VRQEKQGKYFYGGMFFQTCSNNVFSRQSRISGLFSRAFLHGLSRGIAGVAKNVMRKKHNILYHPLDFTTT